MGDGLVALFWAIGISSSTSVVVKLWILCDGANWNSHLVLGIFFNKGGRLEWTKRASEWK